MITHPARANLDRILGPDARAVEIARDDLIALLRVFGAEKLPGRLASTTPPDPADVRQALAFLRYHLDAIESDLDSSSA